MENHKYKLVKASFPSIDLLMDEANPESPVFGLFGPNSYSNNRKEIEKTYTHSAKSPQISFRPARTSESISAAAYDIVDIKEKVLDPRWLQLSNIIRTSKGAYANPPIDENGNVVIDEKILENILGKAEEANGIYLLPNSRSLEVYESSGLSVVDFGFAPNKTIIQGKQTSEQFAQSGLARLLEHTNEKTAINLAKISSPKFYKLGVNVLGFEPVNKPVLRVAGLGSGRGCSDCDRLFVSGVGWGGSLGYAFGMALTSKTI